ncbi:hypothetical protein [uncultured Rikenella sp.]|uniref:hypothetical protein n=1 Tax=uncultured Rikenella sp. TaxID=368003 RepID=UPI0026153C39|nr:hypothetical protein [uncultured Rikenella sp.]
MWGTGDSGYSWSCTTNNHPTGRFLGFSIRTFFTSYAGHRARGLQLRCLSE